MNFEFVRLAKSIKLTCYHGCLENDDPVKTSERLLHHRSFTLDQARDGQN